MKYNAVLDKDLIKKARLYAFFFNWVPALVAMITVILAISVYLFTFELLPTHLVLLVGYLCVMLPRAMQSNILLGMYRKGELALFEQIVRQCCADPRYAPYILSKYATGEYQTVINICAQKLSQRQWNRRLRYIWLSGLADCYFELGDEQKLLLVCDAYDRLAAKENAPRRLAELSKEFDRYRAYAQKDEEKCREILAQGLKTDAPVNIYESAFFAARVSQYVLGDIETARAYYAKAASWNEAYSFVRVAKLELEAMERGECYVDIMPEVLPDPNFVPKAGREYVCNNVGILITYFVVIVIFVLTTICLAPKMMDWQKERELERLLEQKYLDVQDLDCFNVFVNGEIAETMFICRVDDYVLVGNARRGDNETFVYENRYMIPISDLQNPNMRLDPIDHPSGLGYHQITSAFFRSRSEIPVTAYYVTRLEISGQTFYFAVLACTDIPQ